MAQIAYGTKQQKPHHQRVVLFCATPWKLVCKNYLVVLPWWWAFWLAHLIYTS